MAPKNTDSKDKKTKDKSMKSFLIRMFFNRLPIILAFAFFFMFLSFKLLERFPDPFREGIEQYFTASSPYVASIGKLEKIQFFPSLYIGVSDMILHEPGNVALTRMEMDKGKIHIPFFSKFTHSRLLYDFGVENLKADAGTLFPQKIHIESLYFMDVIDPRANPDDRAQLIMAGTYADQDMRLEADLSRKKTWLGYKVYKLNDELPFNFKIGEVTLNANLVYMKEKVAIQDAILTVQGNDIALKDTFFVENRQLAKNNTIMCMLNNDFLKLNTICLDYIENIDLEESTDDATE